MALGLLLVGSTLSSCSDDKGVDTDPDETSGFVKLDMRLDSSPVGAEVEASRSSSLLVSLRDLILTLTDKDRKKTTTHSVDEFAETKEIRTGSYKLEASFGTEGEEGWGKLFCYGLQEFRVRLGKLTEISMPVTMSNSIVEIKYSDSFNEYLTDVTTSVITEAGNSFDWETDKSEDLYISPGTFSVSVSFTKPNGKSATAVVGPYTAEAKHQYVVNLDVDYGSAEQIVLTIDDTVTEKEETIDISDENLPALIKEPEITMSDGFELGDVIDMIEYDKLDKPLTATVLARGRIASAILTTQPIDMGEVGFPVSVDLCNPGADADKLRELGLETRGFAGTGSLFGVIDFTRMVSNIPYINGVSVCRFVLTITDALGNNEVTERLFSVRLTPLELHIVENGKLLVEGSTTIEVETNATSPVFEAKGRSSDSGMMNPLTVTSAVKTGTNSHNGNSIYTLTLSGDVLTFDKETEINVFVADQRVYAEGKILVPSTRIEADKTNAFAKSALVSVLYTTEEAAQGAENVTFEMSTNGTTFTAVPAQLVTAPEKPTAGNRGVYKIAGLNPNTKYTIRSIYNGEKSRGTATFTTENADGSLDTGFDTWESPVQLGDYQTLWNPGGKWATMNSKTTSTHGSGSSMFSYGGTAYRATSGTMPANANIAKNPSPTHYSGNQNQGENAALVRTVGWGSGNTALGGNRGNCDYVTPGELFLGSTDQSFVAHRGIDFGSRPTAISFNYKYLTVNNNDVDYGRAEVIVTDVDGKEHKISKNISLTDNEYTPMRLDIEYTSVAKAKSIEINFISSANPTCATNSDSQYTQHPNAANYTDGEYVGSRLYIDDLKLIYE